MEWMEPRGACAGGCKAGLWLAAHSLECGGVTFLIAAQAFKSSAEGTFGLKFCWLPRRFQLRTEAASAFTLTKPQELHRRMCRRGDCGNGRLI